ncbi:Longitudinals lacking protein, isoforms F/I/K/T [Harpegnathos saltator]|uniref:Longitudinals lacking protein, isoforms F/I/K/T n=1 Tax=Harpegnathos saltator TaxID=610380 RepID=E2BJB2_HARSA|nr:Longitudinals lacking protein, isoforms F/I/K/T [Harpegnathos saltator]
MYSWASNLRKHLKMGCGMVTFETHFSCQYCPYRSRIEASFLKHLLSVHNIKIFLLIPTKTYDCRVVAWEAYRIPITGSGSNSTSDVSRKSRLRHVDQIAGRYKCSKCSKSYRWKHHLVEHVRASCGQKKAECCPYCSYKSNRKWNLKSHIKRIHADA